MSTKKTSASRPKHTKRRAKPWQDVNLLPGLGAGSWDADTEWFTSVATRAAIAGGPSVRVYGRNGLLAEGVTIATITKSIEQIGLRLVYERTLADGDNDAIQAVYAGPRACLKVCWRTHGQRADINVATTDRAIDEGFREIAKASFANRVHARRGSISALVQQPMGGVEIQRIGTVGVRLTRSNYSAKLLDDYDHVLADFQSKTPCGRLVVFSGAPGTGKTFLVRGLIDALGEGATCVLVPPHMMAALADPGFLPAIVAEHCDRDGPLVLICEDGDHCLLQRAADNMSSIQSILNLGDGLLGSMLDVRLVITTNAKLLEIDKAVDRDGRLCRKIVAAPLTGQHANAILSRLVPGRTHWDLKDEVPLATVYKHARTIGWMPAQDSNASASA